MLLKPVEAGLVRFFYTREISKPSIYIYIYIIFSILELGYICIIYVIWKNLDICLSGYVCMKVLIDFSYLFFKVVHKVRQKDMKDRAKCYEILILELIFKINKVFYLF